MLSPSTSFTPFELHLCNQQTGWALESGLDVGRALPGGGGNSGSILGLGPSVINLSEKLPTPLNLENLSGQHSTSGSDKGMASRGTLASTTSESEIVEKWIADRTKWDKMYEKLSLQISEQKSELEDQSRQRAVQSEQLEKITKDMHALEKENCLLKELLQKEMEKGPALPPKRALYAVTGKAERRSPTQFHLTPNPQLNLQSLAIGNPKLNLDDLRTLKLAVEVLSSPHLTEVNQTPVKVKSRAAKSTGKKSSRRKSEKLSEKTRSNRRSKRNKSVPSSTVLRTTLSSRVGVPLQSRRKIKRSTSKVKRTKSIR